MIRPVLCVLFVLALSGCAVVDLAAHGVKEYEKSKEPQTGNAASESAPTPQSVPVMASPRVEDPVLPVETAPPASSDGAIRSQPLD